MLMICIYNQPYVKYTISNVQQLIYRYLSRVTTECRYMDVHFFFPLVFFIGDAMEENNCTILWDYKYKCISCDR